MKMSESETFFSDPKVIVSILAIILSIVSLIWSLANQFDQNKRWDKLNAPNPEINEIRMTICKEISISEAQKLDWGYQPDLYGKGEATGIVYLPYYLSLYNPESNEKIPRVNQVFTIDEAKQELLRLDYRGDINVFKHFKPRITIENMGKTTAKDFTCSVHLKLPNIEWQNAFISNALINLSGGQQTQIMFEFEFPFDIQIPELLRCKIRFEWKNANGKIENKTIGAKWTSSDGIWSYENEID
jgi:hypothetical protein